MPTKTKKTKKPATTVQDKKIRENAEETRRLTSAVRLLVHLVKEISDNSAESSGFHSDSLKQMIVLITNLNERLSQVEKRLPKTL
jgi:hypothetical protein